jgi:hypothetical protein
MEAIIELWNWLAELEPTFAFLLALPFAIAALGLAALGLDHKRVARPRRAGVRAERAGPHVHVQ